MTPDPALWARLEKWLRENTEETFKWWIWSQGYSVSNGDSWYSGRTFNAALRKFLKGVGA